MVNGVLLLVDAAEGPMPQTRFVLQKALELGHKVIVVVNKIDRPDARMRRGHGRGAGAAAGSGRHARSSSTAPTHVLLRHARASRPTAPTSMGTDLTPLFETIVNYIAAPKGDADAPLQMLVSSIDYNEYVGRIGIGRIERGTIQPESGGHHLRLPRPGHHRKGQGRRAVCSSTA